MDYKKKSQETAKDINVLSIFDGMSCGMIALERAGIKVNKYYASEIKKHAIKVSKHNNPQIIHLGDITAWYFWNLPKIDLLIGGSPCQDLTRLKVGDENKGLKGEKSSLFYEYLNILNYYKPKYFLLENVIMKPEYELELSEHLGVKSIRINSNLVSFQNRDRMYWTNIQNVTTPTDKNISFQDYKDTDYNYIKNFKVNKTPSRIKMYKEQCPNVTYRKKINCLTCKQDRRHNSGLIDFENFCRYLTTNELEQSQTVPIDYCQCLTKNQAEDVLGDGWTVDVIAHIFKGLKLEECK